MAVLNCDISKKIISKKKCNGFLQLIPVCSGLRIVRILHCCIILVNYLEPFLNVLLNQIIIFLLFKLFK